MSLAYVAVWYHVIWSKIKENIFYCKRGEKALGIKVIESQILNKGERSINLTNQSFTPGQNGLGNHWP